MAKYQLFFFYNDNKIILQAGEVSQDASKGRGLSRSDGLHVSFHELANTRRFYANVSWNPLPSK